MIDWQDYKYTLLITYPDSSTKEIYSDNTIFLSGLGEEGLKYDLYKDATILFNETVAYQD